ncbi:MAG TPA: HAMP domain-containing sensor histidine kinase, partial [Rugosimonospora sp.]|nr:HAMP domain-containing sensor histidine kinase [Rugosimonospora sp.]
MQITALFAVALLAMGAVAVLVIRQTGRADARRQVAQAVADVDALNNPQPGVWIYELGHHGLRASPGAPAQPADRAALDATDADGRARDAMLRRDGREYVIRTQRVDGHARQAVLDVTEADEERHRVYWGLAGAGAAGVLMAVAVGSLIARRAIVPLGDALARQQRFIADASHELRTPLTQLHTRAQLLERGLRTGGDPQRLGEDARRLVAGTRQLGDIVEELLLAARLRGVPAESGPVPLAALAREAVDAEGPRAAAEGVELAVLTDSAHPDDEYTVPGVAIALRRVLTSLLDNALAHTPSGGHVRVVLSRPEAGDSVRFVVVDDGEGFAEADQELIFERFARGGHRDRRRFGLGLALVREVVQAHGGTVTA